VANDVHAEQVQYGFDSEIIQAQQFITSGEFLGAARLLAQLGSQASQTATTATFEAARVLCVSCAEHLRLANELQRAAQDLIGLVRSLGPAELDRNSEPNRPDPPHHTPTVMSATNSAEPTTEVTVAALGPLEVTIQGDRVTGWGAQKGRVLFEYLVLHAGRHVRRDLLIELLWPAHTSRSARNNLNVCLYGLRQTLRRTRPAGQYVVYRDGCYLLNPQFIWRIDRDEFLSLISRARAEAGAARVERAIELYESAVATYRGELFEDDPNNEWFDAERQSLQEHLLQALDELTELHLRTGNVDAAHNTALSILRRDACHESAHRFLMRCYSQRCQHSLVARQFRLCTTILQAELGVSPADETVSLFSELTAARQQS
jgi:DNA-binding SARP family transcriptional activator